MLINTLFTRSDGAAVPTLTAEGPPGKQQEFSITSPVADVPGDARATCTRVLDGKSVSISRLVSVDDEKKDKCWAKVGVLGDTLVVQMLLRKQGSGFWRVKKLVVTSDNPQPKQSAAKPRPPRITCEDEELGNDLLACARYGEVEDLKAISEEAVPIDFQNESYNTALHYASANGNAECVEFLLSKGARHLPNSSGNTPLHWAVQNKHLVVVKLLLAQAPDVDVLQKNDFGKSILTEAFGLESPDITQLLLEHSSAAGLDAPGQSGIVEEEKEEDVEDGEGGEGAHDEEMHHDDEKEDGGERMEMDSQ